MNKRGIVIVGRTLALVFLLSCLAPVLDGCSFFLGLKMADRAYKKAKRLGCRCTSGSKRLGWCLPLWDDYFQRHARHHNHHKRSDAQEDYEKCLVERLRSAVRARDMDELGEMLARWKSVKKPGRTLREEAPKEIISLLCTNGPEAVDMARFIIAQGFDISISQNEDEVTGCADAEVYWVLAKDEDLYYLKKYLVEHFPLLKTCQPKCPSDLPSYKRGKCCDNVRARVKVLNRLGATRAGIERDRLAKVCPRYQRHYPELIITYHSTYTSEGIPGTRTVVTEVDRFGIPQGSYYAPQWSSPGLPGYTATTTTTERVTISDKDCVACGFTLTRDGECIPPKKDPQ